MSFLITGGLGYLGARMVETVAQKFPDVEVTYTHHSVPEKKHFPHLKNVRFRKLDLTLSSDFNNICQGMTTIIHLAYPNEIVCQQNVEFAIDAGIKGTYRLLTDAQNHGVSNFIFLSTGAVYGPLEGRITEEIITKPESIYGITKKAVEDFVLAARTKSPMNAMAIRLSNGFGYPLNAEINRWTLLVNDLCKQAVVNKQMVLRSSGNQLRDFVNFSDVIQAIIFLSQLTKSETLNGIFNLGSGKSQSVYDFASGILGSAKNVLNYEVTLTRQPAPPNENIKEMTYDIGKLLSLGFKLTGSPSFEIEETLRFCKTHFANS